MAIKSFGINVTANANAIGGIVRASNGGAQAGTIDVTTHDSADNCREFIGGLVDGGEVTLEGHFLYADVGQTYLRNQIYVGTPFAVVLTFVNGNKITYSAFVQSIGGEDAGIDDQVVPFSCTLKVSGKPVYAAS